MKNKVKPKLYLFLLIGLLMLALSMLTSHLQISQTKRGKSSAL
jgi:hypothetical protein